MSTVLVVVESFDGVVSSTVPSVVSGEVFRTNVVVVTADNDVTEASVVVGRSSAAATPLVVAVAGTVGDGEFSSGALDAPPQPAAQIATPITRKIRSLRVHVTEPKLAPPIQLPTVSPSPKPRNGSHHPRLF